MGRPLEKHTYYSSSSMLSLTPSAIRVSEIMTICTADTASLKETAPSTSIHQSIPTDAPISNEMEEAPYIHKRQIICPGSTCWGVGNNGG
ncbi:hypothetical protein VKT23_018476 [Stygiomarasmius scandens]|uniref:Uncharacterized protein n=1 Tax=Marasmiellus scandens TaxID=2682957 RepID=A0ABR1IT99_9AGAR